MSAIFFDPDAEYAVTERRLPHWSQSGTVSFLTWRTWDSMPRDVVESWSRDRAAWLARHGIDPLGPDWKSRVARLSGTDRATYHRLFSDRWQLLLDECHGAGELRSPELSAVVADSLRHFDGDRYRLYDFVVMPNHVHVLASFPNEAGLLAQCDSWKHFTASQINRSLGRTGRFWQADGFDHLVRSDEQFQAFRAYVARNPAVAGLTANEYRHYSLDLSGDGFVRTGHSRSE